MRCCWALVRAQARAWARLEAVTFVASRGELEFTAHDIL